MTSRFAMVIVGAALACTATETGFAQAKAHLKDVEVGPVGGVNIFRFGGSDASGFASRTSFYAGVAVTVPLGRSAFLEPEVLYSEEGAKATFVDSTVGTIEGTYELTYAAVPVLFGVRLEGGGAVDPRVFAGPVFSFNLSCQLKASAAGMSATGTCSDNGIDATSLSVGATFGGAVAFRTGWGALELGLRYTYDFSHAFKESNARNEGLSVGAGLSIPLPK